MDWKLSSHGTEKEISAGDGGWARFCQMECSWEGFPASMEHVPRARACDHCQGSQVKWTEHCEWEASLLRFIPGEKLNESKQQLTFSSKQTNIYRTFGHIRRLGV